MRLAAPPVPPLDARDKLLHAARVGAASDRQFAFWRPLSGVFLVLLVGLLAVGRGSLLRDPGTFWHVRLGEELLSGDGVATVDRFTFTRHGQSWLSLQWLGEALLAAAHRASGWDGVLLLTAAALAGIYTWLTARLNRGGLHWLPAVALVSLVIAASSHHFHARPHLVSIALLGVTFAWLCDVEAGRARIGKLWLLLPLFVLWANLHGGVLAGYATVALATGGWLLRRMLKLSSPLRKRCDVLQAAALLLLLPVAFLINPHGAATPKGWLTILSLPLPDLIQEHKRLNLLRPEGIAALLIAGTYACLLREAWKQGRKANSGPADSPGSRMRRWAVRAAGVPVTWLLPLVWFALAVSRVRHAPLFAIVATLALVEILPRTPLASWLKQWEMFSTPNPRGLATRRSIRRRLAPALIPAVTVMMIAALQALRVAAPVLGGSWARLDATVWPVEIAHDLQRIEGESPRARLLNSLHFGGFVEFHAPGLLTYVDDRCELFGAEFLQRSLRLDFDPAALLVEADRWQADFALLHAGSPADVGLATSADWRLVRRDAVAALYRRAK